AITVDDGPPRTLVRPPPPSQVNLCFRSTANDTCRAIRVSKAIEIPSFLSVPPRSSPRELAPGLRGFVPRGEGAIRISSCRFRRRERTEKARFRAVLRLPGVLSAPWSSLWSWLPGGEV